MIRASLALEGYLYRPHVNCPLSSLSEFVVLLPEAIVESSLPSKILLKHLKLLNESS